MIACTAADCPHGCSGHGKCRFVNELESANTAHSAAIGSSGSTHLYTGWDGNKIQACVCDGGFTGPDCSLRTCPRGDDPITICYETELPQTQRLTLTSTASTGHSVVATYGFTDCTAGNNNLAGDLVLTFIDSHGEQWQTARIPDVFSQTYAEAASRVQTALFGIPNYRASHVTVADAPCVASTSTTMSSVSYDVTFHPPRMGHRQQLLRCDALPLGCTSPGCSPMYTQPNNWMAPGWAATWVGQAWTGAWNGGIGGVVYLLDNSPGTLPSDSPWDSAVQFATVFPSVTDDDNYPFIAPDSVLDNSGWGPYDQAGVQLVITKSPLDALAVYSVYWDIGNTGVFPGSPLIPPQFIPFSDMLETGMSHVFIGYGMYVNLNVGTRAAPVGNAGLNHNTLSQSLTLVFYVATARCNVVESVAPDPELEHVECSGRGLCDRRTGVCKCATGYAGDDCGLELPAATV